MDTTCIALVEGIECKTEATMTSPVPLCGEHQLQIALLIVPDLLATALRAAGAGARPVSLAPDERAAVIAGACPRPVGAYMGGGTHGPVVYFADAGSRIKIGYSTNLRNRIRSLSLQEKDVVLLLQGGLTLERALHDTYAKERIDSTEWFVKSDRLMSFIESKRRELGGQAKRPAQQQGALTPLPKDMPAASRSLPEWADLALPLYQQHVAKAGRRPSAPEMAKLMADAGYGEIKIARSRYIRNAAARLAGSPPAKVRR